MGLECCYCNCFFLLLPTPLSCCTLMCVAVARSGAKQSKAKQSRAHAKCPRPCQCAIPMCNSMQKSIGYTCMRCTLAHFFFLLLLSTSLPISLFHFHIHIPSASYCGFPHSSRCNHFPCALYVFEHVYIRYWSSTCSLSSASWLLQQTCASVLA